MVVVVKIGLKLSKLWPQTIIPFIPTLYMPGSNTALVVVAVLTCGFIVIIVILTILVL